MHQSEIDLKLVARPTEALICDIFSRRFTLHLVLFSRIQ